MDTHLTDFSSGCAVTEWLICFYLNRNAQLRAQRLPKEALSRSGILAISHEDLSEITVLIHRSPKTTTLSLFRRRAVRTRLLPPPN